jgi:hypothetical protein
MKHLTKAIPLIVILGLGSVSAQQTVSDLPEHYMSPGPINLSGPRFGVTVVTGESAEKMRDKFDAAPFISQFGWQHEKRFFTGRGGVHGVTEIVILVGGMEQNLFFPSLSLITGIRSSNGVEFGVGPNLSLAGAAYVVAGGVTLRSGRINFPVNLAVVFAKRSARISLLFGFNM